MDERLVRVLHLRPPRRVVPGLRLWLVGNRHAASGQVLERRLDRGHRIQRIAPAVDDEERLVPEVAGKQLVLLRRVLQHQDVAVQRQEGRVGSRVEHRRRSRRPFRRRKRPTRRRGFRRRCTSASPRRGCRAGCRPARRSTTARRSTRPAARRSARRRRDGRCRSAIAVRSRRAAQRCRRAAGSGPDRRVRDRRPAGTSRK